MPLVVPASQGILAIRISRLTGFPLGYAQLEKLPDGEKYVRISTDVENEDVIVVNTFAHNPDEMLIETVFLIETLRDYNAKSITGVFPYFPYSRQDCRFIKGEAFSLKIVAKLLKMAGIDRMVVVDFHLHRLKDLTSFFGFDVENITAMHKLAEFVRNNFELDDPIVVAPDEEAVQWASVFASDLGVEFIHLNKIRIDAENVIIDSAPREVEGRDVVIVDDMISTGGTVIQAVKALKKAGCNRIYVACTHAILARDALKRLLECGVENLVATDTVLSPISHVSVADIISDYLLSLKW
jgi:ribose-phosphate pyrophosphokinase